MMESWVNFHTKTSVPLHEQFGIKIEGSWVIEDNNQYVWIRESEDAQDMEKKIKSFSGSPEWNGGLRDLAYSHLARIEVQTIEPV